MRSIFCFALVSLSLAGSAQVNELLESNRKGLEILRHSLQAYGGATSTDSLKIAFTCSGGTRENDAAHSKKMML